MQPKTIKSKNNDCGTAPGNLVVKFVSSIPQTGWQIIFSLGMLGDIQETQK